MSIWGKNSERAMPRSPGTPRRAGRDPGVVVRGEGLVDQPLEDRVVEDVPPGLVGERRRRRRRSLNLAVLIRNGEGRPLVVRADGAAGNEDDGEGAATSLRISVPSGAPLGLGPECPRRRERLPGLRLPLAREPLDDHEEHRDEEDRDAGGREHAGDHGGAQDLARGGARPGGDPERHAAEDEGEGRHQDRPQAEPRALERGVDERTALLASSSWRTRRSGSRSWPPGR